MSVRRVHGTEEEDEIGRQAHGKGGMTDQHGTNQRVDLKALRIAGQGHGDAFRQGGLKLGRNAARNRGSGKPEKRASLGANTGGKEVTLRGGQDMPEWIAPTCRSERRRQEQL